MLRLTVLTFTLLVLAFASSSAQERPQVTKDSNGNVTVAFPTVPGRLYNLEAATDGINFAPVPGKWLYGTGTTATLPLLTGPNLPVYGSQNGPPNNSDPYSNLDLQSFPRNIFLRLFLGDTDPTTGLTTITYARYFVGDGDITSEFWDPVYYRDIESVYLWDSSYTDLRTQHPEDLLPPGLPLGINPAGPAIAGTISVQIPSSTLLASRLNGGTLPFTSFLGGTNQLQVQIHPASAMTPLEAGLAGLAQLTYNNLHAATETILSDPSDMGILQTLLGNLANTTPGAPPVIDPPAPGSLEGARLRIRSRPSHLLHAQIPDDWFWFNGYEAAFYDLQLTFTGSLAYLFDSDEDNDDDFMPDAWEVLNNGKTVIRSLGPALPSSTIVLLNALNPADATLDPDQDGLTNLQEYLNNTNPARDDTDGDGASDSAEVNAGANPNNPSDGGNPGGPGSGTVVVDMPFAIGGDYAWWEMKIEGQGPTDTRTLKITSNKEAEEGVGDYVGEIQIIKLHARNKYRITLKRMGGVESEGIGEVGESDYQEGGKWYCWSANVGQNPATNQLLPEVKTFNNYPDSKADRLAEEATAYVVGGASATGQNAVWVVDNKEGLFTLHVDDFKKDVAQTLEAFLLPVEIKEVRFAGSNYHELKSDNGATTYKSPHWVDANGDGTATTNNNEKNYPVAFTRNTKPQLGGKFKVADLPNGLSLKIKAKSAQGLEIPETEVTKDSNGFLILPFTPAINNLGETIEFYNAEDSSAFTITWEVSVGGSGAKFSSTKHTVYITKADPIKTAKNLMRETLFNLGCRNAKGLGSDDQAIVDAIYKDFDDKNIQRVKPSSGTLDGTRMKYWGNPNTAQSETSNLLATGDGSCGAWARFLTDVLRTQGVDAEVIRFDAPTPNIQIIETAIRTKYPNYQGQLTLKFQNPPMPEPRIMVKKWNLENPAAPIDLEGIEAQGNSNPLAFFKDHAVVKFNGKYYDPSYGSAVFPSPEAWEDAALDGFGLLIFANPPLPDQIQTFRKFPPGATIWIWKSNTKESAETIPVPTNY